MKKKAETYDLSSKKKEKYTQKQGDGSPVSKGKTAMKRQTVPLFQA
jgi:hypothetical protein